MTILFKACTVVYRPYIAVLRKTVCDEDMPSIDISTPLYLQLYKYKNLSKQLNYQILSFLGTIPRILENMMLSKSDVFVTFI
jgi:hypothetical protein